MNLIKDGLAPTLGVRLKNRVPIVSTGVESIDELMDGGPPSTSLMLLDEPDSNYFSNAICRCYIAEGLAEQHVQFVASPSSANYDELLNNLPALSEAGASHNMEHKQSPTGPFGTSSSTDFKIAWRYATTPATKKLNQHSGVAKFDLSKRAGNLNDSGVDPHLHLYKPSSSSKRASYKEVCDQLTSLLIIPQSTSTGDGASCARPNFLRILITGVGSPLWGDARHLQRFMFQLRALTRQTGCIVLMAADSSLIDDTTYADMMSYCDACFSLDAMSEAQRKEMSAFQKFDGRFLVKKLCSPFSIAPSHLEHTDLVFTLTRHSFDISVFHLPPAISRDGATDKSSTTAMTASCQRIEGAF